MPHEPKPHLELVSTSDGSFTLLHTGFNQTYHSLNGALQEARHVFLQQGLLYFLNETGTRKARILEVGFGTGLNFLVSAAHCLQNGISLAYTGIEPFPVDREILLKSNYVQSLPDQESQAAYLEWYPGKQPLYLSREQDGFREQDGSRELDEAAAGDIRLELIPQHVLETGPLPPADIVYFDAFAPVTQPEMWTKEVISHVVSALGSGGVFVSYSITGNLKRMLKDLGFRVEKPKGAAGKREMIRAVAPAG